MIRNPCLHRRSYPQGLVNPTEIIIHEVQRYRMAKILSLLLIPVIPATHSGPFRPAVPGDSGHPVGAERRWS
jgi:hypothetical protein